MASAKKCDRCGKYYDVYDGYSGIVPTQHYKRVFEDDHLDLCPNCYTDFEYWLKMIQVPYTYTVEEYEREFGRIKNDNQ